MDANLELPSSQLGTKEYWDEFYANELENFLDHEESGEVWFGMESVRRIVEWITKNTPDKSKSVLDLGCGNGMVLLKLEQLGYTNLAGVDYSQGAIDLATSLAKDKNIVYQCGDLLCLESSPIFSKKYDILLDKGTYDAISLTADEPAVKRKIYMENVHKLTENGGLLWMTSCNWTSKELTNHFTSSGLFSLKEEVPVKQFKFGGHVGQTVSCVIFEAK